MKKISKLHYSRGSVLLFVVLLGMLLFCIIFVQVKLKKNAYEFGQSLAQSYANEEEVRLDLYNNIVILASQYIDEIAESGGSSEEIQQWLESYFLKTVNLVGEDVISPYAVIGGEIVAAVPWEGDDTYQYENTDWYQQAIQGEGKLVSSDAYQDVITGGTTYTISQELSTPGDVIAMDIFLDNQSLSNAASSMPQYSFLYLCDENGKVLYFLSQQEDAIYEQERITTLFQEIESGKYDDYSSSYPDLNNAKRGVYYSYLKNGWMVILTVPIEEIVLGDYERISMVVTGVVTTLFLILLVYAIKERKQAQVIAKADDTIHILSDSYLAIYRIPFLDETYEIIKGNRADELAETGEYQTLFQTIQKHIKEEHKKEFSLNFSLKSICNRVNAGIADYAGDCLYQFDNGYRWVNVRTLYNKERSEEEVLLCLREVDEEKKQQLQYMLILQDAMDASRKSARAKSDFFSHMSHDLRTPLNAIIGFSELAEQTEEDWEKQKGYLQKIALAGKQMLALVNDILEISKIEAGKNRLDFRKFHLKTYIEETTSLFQAQAIQEHKYFSVSFQIQDDVVMGDSFKIGQILTNLLSNAFKYSKEHADIHLDVRQFYTDKYSKYQFVVKDTGVGMTKEFLEKIFDPYSRESVADVVSATGTGLGMSIVKSLVKQMSGNISVDSTLGEGSCFTVTLPLEVVKEEESETKKDVQMPEIQLAGRTILLAEDNAFNMELATDILEMYGCKVLQAVNGKEALEIFRKSAPFSIDAILMDMQMPEMDGCEAAQRIRALTKADAKCIPIIAVTANAFAEDIDQTTKAGMNGHVPKPIDIPLLWRTLEACMKK